MQETIDRSTKPVRRKPSILGEKSRATNERKLVSELVGNGETGNAPVANGRIATDHGRAAETGAKISAGAKLAANAQSHDASQSTATAIRTTTDRQIVSTIFSCFIIWPYTALVSFLTLMIQPGCYRRHGQEAKTYTSLS